ncbi:hypothetical protein CA948_02770 [Alcaligenes aquatilis]|nr:hypothetical protein CA948_02770 [Alcaligenes aquatilis]
MKCLFLCLIMALLPLDTQARNTPCSGKKGGISHCEGEVFVCRDGSASGSKRSCPTYTGTTGRSSPSAPQTLQSNSACTCVSGTYCTGPRGGRYCETSTGSKRYQRK